MSAPAHTELPAREVVDRVTAALVDQGKIIEAGWVGLKLMCGLENAPVLQQLEMRKAFFAGAGHLLNSIMSVLDADAEPTDRDLARMELIHRELEDFLAAFRREHGFVAGGG